MAVEAVAQYRIIRKLVLGGPGEAWLAEDTRLGRKVELRLLPPGMQEAEIGRLLEGARAAAGVEEPHLRAVYETGTHNGGAFIACEHVEGQALAVTLASGALRISDALRVACGVAAGLAEAHAHGLAHGDLRPETVLLTPTGQTRVSGLGLRGLEPPPAGSAAYRAPELAESAAGTAAGDIYSLGVILYQMLTGRLPVAEGNETPPLALLNRDIPATLEQITLRCLAPDPALRYAQAGGLLTELRDIQQQWNTPTGRNLIWRAVLAMGILLVVLAGAGLAIWWLERAPRPVDINSVAVLPLWTGAGALQDDAIADGIADELIARLSRLRNLRVVPYSVASRFPRSTRDPVAFARDLGVEAVLHGTLRKSGDVLTLSVHLVRANGMELWAADDIQADPHDLMRAEHDIAQQVAGKLRRQLNNEEQADLARAGTQNEQAFDLVVSGKGHYFRAAVPGPTAPTQRALARADLEQALAADPEFAQAHAWLALTLFNQFRAGEAPRSILDTAQQHALKALSLDPMLATALRALVRVYNETGQTEEAVRTAHQIVQNGSPDPEALEAAGLGYAAASLLDRAIPLFEKAVSADPANANIRADLARCYLYSGQPQKGLARLAPVLQPYTGGGWAALLVNAALKRYDDAIRFGRLAVEADPAELTAWLDLGRVYAQAGRHAEALAAWKQGSLVALHDNPRSRAGVALLKAAAGARDEAIAHLNIALAAESRDSWVLYQAACVHAYLGDRPRAYDMLRAAVLHGFLALDELAADSQPAGPWFHFSDDRDLHSYQRQIAANVEQLRRLY